MPRVFTIPYRLKQISTSLVREWFRRVCFGCALSFLCGVLPVSWASADEDEDEDAADEVVVTGTKRKMDRRSSPVNTEVISREDIERSGTENVADLLEDQLGVVVTRSLRGTGIRMQGLDPKHTLLLVDGERLLGAKDGYIDLTRFPLESIERIEVVKGPQSALYGSEAMGGVINLITREGNEPFALDFHARYGSRSVFDGYAGVSLRNDRVRNRFVAGWHSGAAYDLDPSDEATTGSAIRQFDLFDQARLQLSPDMWLVGRVSYLQRKMTGVDSNGLALLDRSNLTEDFQSALKYRWIPDEKSFLSIDSGFSLYRDQYLVDQRKSEALDQYQETIEHLGTVHVQYDRRIGAGHWVTVGFDGFLQDMISDRLEDERGFRQRYALFAQDMWTLGADDQWVLFPGVRVDVDSWFGVNPTPKLAVRYAPLEKLVFRASYGLGYRAPDFKEMLLFFENTGAGYTVEGNPHLKPERSQSVQVGVESVPHKSVELTMNGFFNDIDDLISIGTLEEPRVGAATRYGYINVGKARTMGVETQARLKWDEALAVQVGYTLTEAKDVEQERRLEGQPIHQGNLSLSGFHEGSGLRFLGRAALFGDRAFYVDVDGDSEDDLVLAKPYVTVDVRLSLDVKSYSVFIGVDNLLNEGDVEFSPIPPMMVYGGITGRIANKDSRVK